MLKPVKTKLMLVLPLAVTLVLALLAIQLSAQDVVSPECIVRLEGHKFLDVNGNGLWDKPDEPPLQGWKIKLSNGRTTYTDANGYYAFENLEGGTYTVAEVCPAAWVQTAPGFTDLNTCGTFTHTVTLGLDNREAKDLDFGNGRPELTVAKECTPAVFLGDTIDYKITVTNTGNVLLKDVAVEDPVIDLNAMVDLTPGESRTFTGMVDTFPADGRGCGFSYVIFLPVVMRGAGTAPAQAQALQEDVANTATATSQYALATVTGSDSCTTKVYELEVRKSAQTFFKRTYQWTIDKVVDDPGPIALLPGASATPRYTVTVNLADPPYIDSDWAVQGVISITNPAPMDAPLASVADLMSPVVPVSVSCPSLTVPKEGSLTCTYGPVKVSDASSRTNNAKATLIISPTRTIDFCSSAAVSFEQTPSQLFDAEVQVKDIFTGTSGTVVDSLGTVRYDQVPKSFTYTRTVQAPPGGICDLFEVPNEATLKTNDSSTVISDHAKVQILELCTVSLAYEDLPLGSPNMDWDYNDWVATVDISPTFSASTPGALLRMELTINPEARGAAFRHEFWLRFPRDTFACPGTYTRTLFDGKGNTLEQEAGVPFNPSVDNNFAVIPLTGDALPTMSDTDEAFPYIPTNRTAQLSIAFSEPCPFAFHFDPAASVHGDGLFFAPRLHVLNTGQDVNPGDSRTLLVPIDWVWPEEKVAVWRAYPDVTPGAPPIFTIPWWRNPTNLVYGLKP